MDLAFKSADNSASYPKVSEYKENKVGANEDIGEMSDGKEEIAAILGIEEDITQLPEDVMENIGEVNDAIEFLIEKRNLTPSKETYQKLLEEIRSDMGIDKLADPIFALEKMAKTLGAWEDISYIRDINVKKELFAKLAQASTSKEMDRIILKAMEDYE